MTVTFHRGPDGFTKALSAKDQASVDAETERIKASRVGPGSRPHKFKPARWTHPNGHPRCRVCGAEQRLPDGFDTTGVPPDEWPTAPCEGYKPVAKHGDKGDPGYLALHPGRRRRVATPLAPAPSVPTLSDHPLTRSPFEDTDPSTAAPKQKAAINRGVRHPTVKPLALIRWLVRLVTPPGGTVLDPFLGSGTTAEAALLEGFDWIGCERTVEYLPLIQARLDRFAAGRSPGLPPPRPARVEAEGQASLFG